MNPNTQKAIRSFAPAAALFVLLFCMFDFNAFHVANQSWFNNFQTDSDTTVLGRIAATRQEGFTSHGALSGHYSNNGRPASPQIPLQFGIYFNGLQPGAEWQMYPPNVGLPGMVFGLIDSMLPAQEGNFIFYRMLASAFAAATVTGLIVWVGLEIGIAGALAIVLGLFVSPWFIVWGKSIFHVIGTWFLPVLVTCWGFRRLRRDKSENATRIMIALFATFCIRIACGNEYLTTIVTMAWIPVLFYAIRDEWPWRRFVQTTLLIGGVSIAAFLFILAVDILMVDSAQHQGLETAFATIISHFEVRVGTPLMEKNFMNPSLILDKRGLDVSIWRVVEMYFEGYVSGPVLADEPLDWPPTFGDLIFLALAASLPVLFARATVGKAVTPRLRMLTALVAAMAAGFYGALSWHVIVHEHSIECRHMNFVLWYLPFVLLLYALIGEITLGAFLMKFFPEMMPEAPVKPRVKHRIRKSRG